MKTTCRMLLFLIAGFAAQGVEPISIEEFKKIPSEVERAKIIEQAPPEQKEELWKLSVHLERARAWGGEAGLKGARERAMLGARGLGNLGTLFSQQINVWQVYIGGVEEANEKAGKTKQELAEIEKKLMAEEEALSKRLPIVDSLLLHLAASPRALELNKEADKLADEMFKKTSTDGITPFHPITTEERMAFDKRVEQIFQEIKRLPKLSPQQVQKEFDATTEDKVIGGSTD